MLDPIQRMNTFTTLGISGPNTCDVACVEMEHCQQSGRAWQIILT